MQYHQPYIQMSAAVLLTISICNFIYVLAALCNFLTIKKTASKPILTADWLVPEPVSLHKVGFASGWEHCEQRVA